MPKWPAVFCCLIFFLLRLSWAALAETNSWTNSASGNWEDSYWSLGLPTNNQDVSFTNASSKTLAIGPATVQNFPETLTLNSVTISSPSNSFNRLLLNFSGTDTPLVVRSLTLGSNSAMTMLSSSLFLDGPNSVGMQVGGEFNQNESVVSGRQVNVGYIGPGVYNFNSGIFAISNLWVGGAYSGIFNQNGGTNTTLIADVEGGEYDLNGGYFNSTIYFNNGGTFRQRGGNLDVPLTLFSGQYFLEGGTHSGGITVPSPDGLGRFGAGNVWQSGGTNLGGIDVGEYGRGSYTMSNGFCAGKLFVHDQGYYTQWNGTLIGGDVTIDGGPVNTKGGGGELLMGAFELNGGTVLCSSIVASGNYDQSNATNYVAGTLTVFGEFGHFFSDGMICASNLTLDLFHNEGAAKSVSFNGTTVVTNELLVYDIPGFQGSGNLIVSNITLTSGAAFGFRGAISQSGILSAVGATIGLSGVGPYHFGQLQGSGNSLIFGSSQCHVNFADGSGSAWPGPMLTVKQWSGSLYGGGGHRISFGTNGLALTSQQLSAIQFQNPAGLPAGNYPARILATGEIVPHTGAPLPMKMTIVCSLTNSAMQLDLSGDIGQSYDIEVSSDLVNWTWWTNQFNSNGTISIPDCGATNYPQRFYRARPVP